MWTTCLRPRSLYACVFCWISIVGGRFLAPFLEHEAKMSAMEIGGILALQQVVFVIGTSVVGSFADHCDRLYPGKGRAWVMSTGISMGGIAFVLHGLSNVFPSSPFCRSIIWHAGLRVLFAIAMSMTFPVMDGMCMDYLKRKTDSTTQDYGKERLYGAVSWGVANLILSLLLDAYGFSVLYLLAVIITLGSIAVIMAFSSHQTRSDTPTYKRNDSNVIHNDETDSSLPSQTLSSTFHLWRVLVSSWFGATFMVAQITQSSGQAIIDSLVFLFFEALGSSFKVMGFTVVLTVAFEIPIFHIAPTLLKTIGPGRLIQIAAFAYVVRVVGYSLVPKGHVLWVLLLEPLHGVTFACGATAGVEIVSSMAPPGYEASGQSLLQVFVGTGSVIGLLFGGVLEDTIGPRIMYRVSAFVVFIGCLVFSTVLCTSGPRLDQNNLAATEDGGGARHEKLPQADEEDKCNDNNDTGVAVELAGVSLDSNRSVDENMLL